MFCVHRRRAEGGFYLLVQELRLENFSTSCFVFSMRVEGVAELF